MCTPPPLHHRGCFGDAPPGMRRVEGWALMGADYQRGLVWVLRCLLEIVYGMEYLHSLSIVHGDLKCANVLCKSSTSDARGFTCKASTSAHNQGSAGMILKLTAASSLCLMQPRTQRRDGRCSWLSRFYKNRDMPAEINCALSTKLWQPSAAAHFEALAFTREGVAPVNTKRVEDKLLLA